jgi:non-heme chloroperoxidase
LRGGINSRKLNGNAIARHSNGCLSIRLDPGKCHALPEMFYGANRPGAKVSQGMLDQFWLWSMQGGLQNIYDSIKAFSETDFTEDLKKFDVPTLVMHGEDDQIVPIKDSSKKSAKLIKGAQEIYYPGRPHGLTATHQDEVNADLLKFLRSVQQARKAA